jgi:hypothetical protein
VLRRYFSELGRKSVEARMRKLSPEERQKIGRYAAEARWSKRKKKGKKAKRGRKA